MRKSLRYSQAFKINNNSLGHCLQAGCPKIIQQESLLQPVIAYYQWLRSLSNSAWTWELRVEHVLTVLLALVWAFRPVHTDFPQCACTWRANSSGKILLNRRSTHTPTTSLNASSPQKASPQTQVCLGFKLQSYWSGRGTLSMLKIEYSLLLIFPAVEMC